MMKKIKGKISKYYLFIHFALEKKIKVNQEKLVYKINSKNLLS